MVWRDRQIDTHTLREGEISTHISHSWLTISKLGCLFCSTLYFSHKSLKTLSHPEGFLVSYFPVVQNLAFPDQEARFNLEFSKISWRKKW